ncbi:MFS transporter [Kitasatospora sp. A2-31]|uniref:MFS transporter n=1 Tax=Kitasatospora sp. A2-31 TaxID=2916414 RepID=UPI001EEB9948|nr:MFS transporter [Kitasatospora sp. A2-31]MCG6494346.1 MFS transporter [Kitasatospora sp. A2-31]
MVAVLRNRTYRHLFTAQVVALVGTGLATVALSLLAYRIAGDGASAVLGTALAIKMIAYVGIAPVLGAVADRIPRRAVMVAMDLTRAVVALALPFVDQVWQVYVLIFLLQSASAAFTPTFQATIPEVLPAERDYTQALSMTRIAYDLESLFSPALAAALLTVVTYNWLFIGTAAGFLASAALVVSAVLPRPKPVERPGGLHHKAAFGTRLYWATPRLRALLALDLVVAAAGAVVFVNTVVIVQGHFHKPPGFVSLALGAYGVGSILAALLLPAVLRRLGDRSVMLPAAFTLPGVLAAVAAVTSAGPDGWSWAALLVSWAAIGAACSAVLTPAGRVIRRSAGDADLPAAFAAQFSLSHSCWLVTYPLAGWLAAGAGLAVTAIVLGVVALAAVVGATVLWPRQDPATLGHVHHDLPDDHPHLADARRTGDGWSHGHDFVIDALHARWPRPVERAAGRV